MFIVLTFYKDGTNREDYYQDIRTARACAAIRKTRKDKPVIKSLVMTEYQEILWEV
jgi:hypothetical protein